MVRRACGPALYRVGLSALCTSCGKPRISEAQTEQFRAGHPCQRVVFEWVAVARFADPLVDQPDVHVEGRTLHAGERLTDNHDYDPELLLEFPHEGLARRPAGLHVPAGEIPDVGIPLALRGTVDHQRATMAAQQPGDDVRIGRCLLHRLSLTAQQISMPERVLSAPFTELRRPQAPTTKPVP